MRGQLIKIGKEKIEKAMEFSKKVVIRNDYSDSNQTNFEKIENDHFISKICEEAVIIAHKNVGLKTTDVDYKIYKQNEKSWDSDLKRIYPELQGSIPPLPLAVKGQSKTSAEKYELSWMFQNSESRKDIILKKDFCEQLVFLVYCNDKVKTYDCWVYPPVKMKDIIPILKDPKSKHLKGKKLVVYYKDLKNILEQKND